MIDLWADLIPLRRPQFELRGNELFFLISERPYAIINADEATLWEKIDGKITIKQLRSLFGEAATIALSNLVNISVCEVAPTSFIPLRKRVLIIEPHMDDAILSVGGIMWATRNEREFTIASVAGRSNFTSYYDLDREYFDIDAITELRKAESALAMRMLGGHHIILDQLEAPLRYSDKKWTIEWYRKNRVPIGAFIIHYFSSEELEKWSEAISRLLVYCDADEIWMPLGIGGHVDHELTRNACIDALPIIKIRNYRPIIYFYQDVPYAIECRNQTKDTLSQLINAGARINIKEVDIRESLANKMRLISYYGSQFKMSYMAPKVEKASRLASSSGKGYSELLFRISGNPRHVNKVALYCRAHKVHAVEKKLMPWYYRHGEAKRIRIISPTAMGRYANDIAELLNAFPKAVLEIHISFEHKAEIETFSSERIHIRIVKGAKFGWLKRLFKIAISRPCPLIVMVDEDCEAVAKIACKVCFTSDPLNAKRLGYLVLAMRSVRANKIARNY